MLGHKLFETLMPYFNVFSTIKGQNIPNKILKYKDNIIENIDVLNYNKLNNIIKDINPFIIINCVGLIKQKNNVAYCDFFEINSLFPHILSKIDKNIKIVTFSTDCVFSGKKGDYIEEDMTDSDDLYGKSKILGELYYDNSLTIRTSIIGFEIKNKLGLIEWFLKNANNEIDGYDKCIYTGLTTIELSNIILKIIKNELIYKMKGIFHISSEKISKYKLLLNFSKKMNMEVCINRNNNIKINRSLCCDKFMNISNNININNWDIMLDNLVDDYKNYNIL